MLTWHMLRAAAIARHRMVWRACGSNPATWELHMDMIRPSMAIDRMNEDKLQAAISRAARAQALLENELLQDAFRKLEDDYVAAWKTWPAADRDGRERLWQAVNVLGKVRDHLARMVADGKLAQRELSDLVHKLQ